MMTKETFDQWVKDIFTPTAVTPMPRQVFAGKDWLESIYKQLGHKGFVAWIKDPKRNMMIITGDEGMRFIESILAKEEDATPLSTPLNSTL